MTEFSVQFDQCEFLPDFTSGSTTLPHENIQRQEVDTQNLLIQQQANEAILVAIKNKLGQIENSIKAYEEDIDSRAQHFAESFTRLVFGNDNELVLEKLKTHLTTGLSALNLAGDVKVWVHPNHISDIQQYCENALPGKLELHADPLLEISDCRIEGPDSGLIARIENQLEQSRQMLFESQELKNE